jgi:HSP20 family molecular chaperone IbpA
VTPFVVRVFLYRLDPSAWSLPALVHGTLPDAVEQRRGEREVRFTTTTDEPGAVLAGTIRELDRFAINWRELVLVEGIFEAELPGIEREDVDVELPGKPDPAQVEATLSEGVLTVRVPKPEPSRAQRIEVQASA